MAIYRMADLNIDIQNEHQYTSRICKDYLAPDGVHVRVYGSKPFPTHALSTAISRCFALQTDAFGFMARLGAARKTIR